MFRGPEWLIGKKMNKELIRLSSFRSYPNFEVFTIKLAKAGFVYEEIGDEVKCCECGITYKQWRKGDDPIEIHLRLSPECSFLTREVNIKNIRRNSIIKNHRRIFNESSESLLTPHPMITKQNVLLDAPTLSSIQRSSFPIEQQLPLRTDGRQLTEKTAAKLGYWKDGTMKDPDVNFIAPVFNSSQQKVNVSGDKKEILVRLSSSDRGEAANVLIKEGTTSQICTNEGRLGEFTLVLKLSWRK